METQPQHPVIILGAGLSGLAAAHFLAKLLPGVEPLLLEAGDRPGGAVRSFHEEGYLAEWGPHGFLDNSAESRELLADTGLDREAQRAPLGDFRRFLCHRGRLEPLPQSPKQLLTTPLLPLLGKLRLLGDLWKRPKAEPQTIGQWASYRFGPAVLPLIDAAVTGTFAGDYERLSIDAVMPGVRALERNHGSVLRGLKAKKKEAGRQAGGPKPLPAMVSFPQGMERIIEVLAAPCTIRYRTAVKAVARDDDGWRLTTDGGEMRAAQLVVALPVNRALELLAGLRQPPVPRIPEARINNVVLGYAADNNRIPRGFGYLAPEREGRFALGAMFSSHMFPGRAPAGHLLVEALVGGRRHPERLEIGDGEMIERVCRDLGELLDLPDKPAFAKVLRPGGGIPQLEMDHPALLEWRRELERSHAGLALCGFGWDGIGMNDMMKHAKRAAQAIAAGSGRPEQEAPVRPVYF